MNLNDYATDCHTRSVYAGWWEELEVIRSYLPQHLHRTVTAWFLGTKIALIHSEISEMLEGLRKENQDDHLPHRSAEEVEAADALIRMFDYIGHRRLDAQGAYRDKTEYNNARADHKPEARAASGGKKF